MAFLQKRKNSKGETVWVIHYRKGKKQKMKTIGKTDKRTAEQRLKKFCNDLSAEEFGVREIKKITIMEFEKEYFKYAIAEKAIRTVDRERQIIKSFSTYFGNIYLNQLVTKDINDYRNERLKHVSAETINLEFRHLKAFLNTAIKLGYLKTNPFIEIKPLRRAEKDSIQFFELEDIEKVREAFKEDDFKYLVEFYLLTGARLKEPLSLKWDDVDFRREQLTIRGIYTKAKKNRIISFKSDRKLKRLLKAIPRRDDNLLFGPLDGSPQWSYWWVARKISLVFTRIGFPWVSCHTFRHTYISHLVLSGIPLTVVQHLVGHSNFTTTLKYAHLAPNHKDEMIEKRPY